MMEPRESTPFTTAYRILKVVPSGPSKIVVADPLKTSATLAKLEINVVTKAPPPELVRDKPDEPCLYIPFQQYDDFVNAVNYRPKSDRLEQLHEPASVQ